MMKFYNPYDAVETAMVEAIAEYFAEYGDDCDDWKEDGEWTLDRRDIRFVMDELLPDAEKTLKKIMAILEA